MEDKKMEAQVKAAVSSMNARVTRGAKVQVDAIVTTLDAIQNIEHFEDLHARLLKVKKELEKISVELDDLSGSYDVANTNIQLSNLGAN